MVNTNLRFENLQYIVMEGGGARGAAYLGAIQALEEKMEERSRLDSSIDSYTLEGGRKPGLLDYFEVENNTPVIKGIAGSSAGAITTFALGLGLNSEEINEILQYPFAKFLEEKDAGKYRAIDEDGNLAVGEDKKNDVTGSKELSINKKFEFLFDRDATQVGGNLVKLGLRNLYFTLGTKVVFDGLGSNLNQLIDLQNRLANVTSSNNIPTFWRGGLRFLLRTDNSFLRKLGWQKLMNLLLFKLILPKVLKAPLKFDADNLTNLIADRGMFSGFSVREFFMDMVIFAVIRDTQFQRGILKEFTTAEQAELKKELKTVTDFKIGKRAGAKLKEAIKGSHATKFFDLISNITFIQFKKISGINFGMCVSNLTSGFPCYFGREWTPDFRVMEAVAGSMTIPPAIKLLYNASNVVKTDSKKVTIEINGATKVFVDDNGNFNLQDFYLYQHILKIALAEQIRNDNNIEDRAVVNVNNTIDVSAFLPKLKDLVVGEVNRDPEGDIKNPDKTIALPVIVGGNTYKVDFSLMRFFYNATYKGLLLDGGYRNNIPYNFFRMRNGNINTVFAIKLDEHFPPTLLEGIYNSIKNELAKADKDQMISYYELAELEDPMLSAVIEQLGLVEKEVKEAVRTQVRLIFNDYLENWESRAENEEDRQKRKAVKKQVRNNDKAIRRLSKSTLKQYKKNRLTAPWEQPVAIFATAFDGYSYGSEKGQVRHISDHNHILPLYDYGIGTFDFDMKKVQPMIDLAQAMAREETLNFFK